MTASKVKTVVKPDLCCHDCHGAYKVREYWEGSYRRLFCHKCYAWYKRYQKLAGVKTPPWSVLNPPPDAHPRYTLVVEAGETKRYDPAHVSDWGNDHVVAALTLA